MATIPNYSVNTSMPTEATRSVDPSARGYDIGKKMGEIGTAIGTMATAQKSADDKKKIDEYVMAYNNPNDATIFSGMQGSLRSAKLARLLMPLDKDLADTYLAKSNKEKADEEGISRNMEVVNARKGVSSTEPDAKKNQSIEAEIALIDAELKASEEKVGENESPAENATENPSVETHTDFAPALPAGSIPAPTGVVAPPAGVPMVSYSGGSPRTYPQQSPYGSDYAPTFKPVFGGMSTPTLSPIPNNNFTPFVPSALNTRIEPTQRYNIDMPIAPEPRKIPWKL